MLLVVKRAWVLALGALGTLLVASVVLGWTTTATSEYVIVLSCQRIDMLEE